MVHDDEIFLGPYAGVGRISPRSADTYATIDTHTNFPEVAPEPVMDFYGRDKLTASEARQAGGSAPTAAGDTPTICGLKRKTFIIVLAVAAIVVVSAIVGGVAGELSAKNDGSNSDSDKKSSSSSDDDDQVPAAKTSAGSPQPTGPTEPEDRAMAASTSSDSNVQLFYQDLDTTNILYRRIRDDQAAGEQTLGLDIEPGWGTSMAAAALNGSDPVLTRVFYVAEENGRTDIVQATLQCDGDGDTCSTTSNSIISSNITGDVHSQTKLSALYLHEDFIRVYYQAGGGHIWALTGDDGEEWGQTHLISEAYPGSGIVTAAADEDNIYLFFVSEESERLRFMVYSDILGADDDRSITDSPGSTWSPTVSLTGVYVPMSDPYRVYYAPPDDGPIVSFWQPPGQENTWFKNHEDTWGKIEGGFATAAWADQVRIYYFQDGELVVSAQDNTTWLEIAPV